jgi:RHS repeat-associated protein
VATTTYDPWGDIRSDQMSIVDQTTELTDSSTMGFQGDVTDDDTGLVDMGARNYAPGMGRFTTVDPASPTYSDPFSVNAWIYGGDSPVTMWDPTGRSQCAERGWCSANDQGRGHSSRTQDVHVPPESRQLQTSSDSSPTTMSQGGHTITMSQGGHTTTMSRDTGTGVAPKEPDPWGCAAGFGVAAGSGYVIQQGMWMTLSGAAAFAGGPEVWPEAGITVVAGSGMVLGGADLFSYGFDLIGASC